MAFKHKNRWLWIMVLMLLLGGPVWAREAPYLVERHDVVAELSPDGKAHMTETIRFLLYEDRRDFVFPIPYQSGQTVQVNRIALSDSNPEANQNLFSELVLAEAGGAVSAMSYNLKDDGQKLDVQLHLLLKAGSARTIRIDYTVSPAVVLHKDTALFQTRFFQYDSDVDVHLATVQLLFPDSVQPEDIWILPSSSADFYQTWTARNELFLAADSLDETLNLTCLFPKEDLPLAPAAQTPLTAESIRQQALQADAALHKNLSRHQMAWDAVFFLLGLAVVCFLLIFFIFGKEKISSRQPYYLRDAPYACPPVVLSLLIGRKRPARLMLTVLLSLVQKGYLVMDGAVFKKAGPIDAIEDSLSGSERYLLHWFFDDLATDESLRISEVRKLARRKETAEPFQKRYREWRTMLSKELAEQGLIDCKKTRYGRLVIGLAGGVYLILAIILTAFLKSFVPLLLLIPAAGFLILSFHVRRLGNQGVARYIEGRALARYLRNIKQLPPYPDVNQQGQLLPYALALGLIQSYLRILPELWKNQPIQDQLAVYGLSVQKNRPLDEQMAHLAEDLRLMESLLESSLLLSRRMAG